MKSNLFCILELTIRSISKEYMFNNIIISGGNTLFGGFTERLIDLFRPWVWTHFST
ncbi:MAG: hypothetical protein GPJ54_21305 [Candidatus Heimdallarchaeota archaeon]|nr:hypothetical protein [Candidatus Heimdallarchaeota archaeon]